MQTKLYIHFMEDDFMKKKMGFNHVDIEHDTFDAIQSKIIHYGWVKAKRDLRKDGSVFIPEGTIGKVLAHVPFTINPERCHFCIEWQKSVVKVPSYDDFGLTVWKEYHECSQSYRLHNGTYNEYAKKSIELRATGKIASYVANELIPLERVR